MTTSSVTTTADEKRNQGVSLPHRTLKSRWWHLAVPCQKIMEDSEAGLYLLKTNCVPFPISSTFYIRILLILQVRPISIVTSSVISPAGSHFCFLWDITAQYLYCLNAFSIFCIYICYLVTCLMFPARFKLFRDGFHVWFSFVFHITLSTSSQFIFIELMKDEPMLN